MALLPFLSLPLFLGRVCAASMIITVQMLLIFLVMQILLLRRSAFRARRTVSLRRLAVFLVQSCSWKLHGARLISMVHCVLLMLIRRIVRV